MMISDSDKGQMTKVICFLALHVLLLTLSNEKNPINLCAYDQFQSSTERPKGEKPHLESSWLSHHSAAMLL